MPSSSRRWPRCRQYSPCCDFEATIAALPADELDPAELAETRRLIADQINRLRPRGVKRLAYGFAAIVLCSAMALVLTMVGLATAFALYVVFHALWLG